FWELGASRDTVGPKSGNARYICNITVNVPGTGSQLETASDLSLEALDTSVTLHKCSGKWEPARDTVGLKSGSAGYICNITVNVLGSGSQLETPSDFVWKRWIHL
ncbi:hypothetical protein RRG08_033401, partial [Elysia crispata]